MAAHTTFSLLKLRRFGPFFWTQFLGAFNDNVYKNALLILIAFQGARWGANNPDLYINLAAGLFVLPFFLFSPLAGQLADKLEKSQLMRLVKLAEIGIMCLAVVGLLMQSLWLLIAVLFLMGTQSSVFGPAKYGILPQHLSDDELVAGNGLVEMGTFLAILIGTLLGGILIERADLGPLLVSVVVIGVAVAGYLAARGIPLAPAVAPDLKINWNIVTEIGRNLRFTYGNRTVFLAIIGISWFWFFGAVYLTQFPNYTKLALGGNEYVGTLLLSAFSIGIGLGSLLCDRMSGQRVELGLVPFGAIGITVFAVDMYFTVPGLAPVAAAIGPLEFLQSPHGWRLLADIVLLGLFGGFYIVPLYALIQQRSEPSHRSRIIAGNNVLNALAMVLSAVFAVLLLSVAGLTIPQLFLLVGVLNAVVAIYIFTLVPEFLLRFIAWMAVHAVYRLRKQGLEHIPEEGPAVIVCNHVGYADAIIIAGAVRRPVRFVMYHKIFSIPGLSLLFRWMNAIPIASAKEAPELLAQAYERIDAALADGELVCIFPEGGLSADGQLQEFRRGVEQIVRRRPVPVVPMALEGVWGSLFSRAGSRAFFKLPRRVWARIGLSAGLPVPPEAATAEALRNRVAQLKDGAA
jgi:1-acyl-sn-glycerol-3-phosphate acyltransferase